MCIFRKVLQNTFIPWRPAVPLEWLFFTPPFWCNLCLILRVWANTRPACREYARRSKDGFEHPEFSILKAPIKKILGVHHVRSAFSCFRSPPDAASLAALLQSAAQALLRSGTPSDEEHPAPAKVERIQEEIRHYRFPPLAVRCEKELLEEENAEEMRELLFRAFSSLETFADLLELMNPEAKVEGVVMHTLARELRRIGRLVFKIQDAYSTVELVEA